VDAEVVNFGERTNSPESLAHVPGVGSGEFLYVPVFDVRLRRKQIFMPPLVAASYLTFYPFCESV
jgi:hypothetical protein